MRDIKDLEIVCEFGYGVQINRLYTPMLDGLLMVSSVLAGHGKSLVLTRWETARTVDAETQQILPSNLSFEFRCHGCSANQMNVIWRELSRVLDTIDKHWTVVYTDNIIECSYDINKVIPCQDSV
jgi:hypothetical protein